MPELSIRGAGQKDRSYGNENAAGCNRRTCAVKLLPVAVSAPATAICLKPLLKCTRVHNEIEKKNNDLIIRSTGVLYFCSPFVFFPFGIPCIANEEREPARLFCRTRSKENLHRVISLKDSRN